MAVYYVGSGGNDTNDGLSWANRFLTLNGAEDEPVAAGDTVYVAPGVYRETLTCDVAGTSGNPITYIGDVTGDNTDGVGGTVRITGSDNDQTETRSNCIVCNRDYRTFRGLAMDAGTSYIITSSAPTSLIIEDCSIVTRQGGNTAGIFISGTSDGTIIRRCFFHCLRDAGIYFYRSSDHTTANATVENCVFIGGGRTNVGSVSSYYVGGITIKNCTITGSNLGIETAVSMTGVVTVNNCIIAGCNTGLKASASGDLVEDYNAVYGNGTDRSNVTAGTNSVSYPALYDAPILMDGIEYGAAFSAKLSEWSQIARIAGTGEATDDFYGITRPTTSAKKSWGAIQYQPSERETTTTQGSSTASIKLADAGAHQIFVPTTNASTTITVYCYRETNYAGTLPTMVIKQPGVADRTTTDTGSVSTWNQLSDTFTPAADPPYCVVELQSLNTATSGSYAAFFDTLEVA